MLCDPCRWPRTGVTRRRGYRVRRHPWSRSRDPLEWAGAADSQGPHQPAARRSTRRPTAHGGWLRLGVGRQLVDWRQPRHGLSSCRRAAPLRAGHAGGPVLERFRFLQAVVSVLGFVTARFRDPPPGDREARQRILHQILRPMCDVSNDRTTPLTASMDRLGANEPAAVVSAFP